MSIQTLTHIIYSSLVSIYLFIIVPFSIGTLICSKLKGEMFESLAYRFVVGFLSMLGIWAALALPFALFLKEKPFHYLRYAYILTITILCIIYVVIGRGKDDTFKVIVNTIQRTWKTLFESGTDRKYMAISVLILLFQLFETAFFAPVGYVQDDFYYYVDVNRTVYKDVLCFVGTKQTLAQWYMFLSFIATTTHIPSIIICRTLIPMYMIIILYSSLYSFGKYCFKVDIRKEWVYLMWSSLILEALSYSYYQFFMSLYISTWGKIIAGMIAVPVLLMTLNTVADVDIRTGSIALNKSILLIAIGAGAATLSIASMISGSIALFLFMVYFSIYYRKKEIAIYIIMAGLPFAIQLLAYVAVW